MNFNGLLIAALMLTTADLHARETSPMEMRDQVARAELIARVIVRDVVEPKVKMPGVREYAVIEVKELIKGTADEFGNRFVTRGFSQELDPVGCCEAGSEYLVLAYRGYPVFGEIDGMDAIILKNKDEYLSPVNGPFSTFPICGDAVSGWSSDGESTNAKEAIREIESLLAK